MPGEVRRLHGLRPVQGLPQVDRGRVDRERVADDVDEPGVGKHLEQRRDATGVRRGLEDEPPRVAQRHRLEEPHERPLPRGPHTRRQVVEVQGLGSIGPRFGNAMVRYGDG